MPEIPEEIAAAVHAGQMPFAIFADWLEDDADWPAAARGIRLLDSMALEIKHLRVVLPEGIRPLFTKACQPADVVRLCDSLAWSAIVIPEWGNLYLREWRTAYPYRQRQRCQVCGRARNLSPLRICKACTEGHRDALTLLIPSRSEVEHLQAQRDRARLPKGPLS